MTTNPVRWLFGLDTAEALFAALGVCGDARGGGRVRLADGREAWHAGAHWLVGDPHDLAVLMPGPTPASDR